LTNLQFIKGSFDEMKVYFGVCGVGLGHIGRCLPVAKALSERGNQILFSTYSDACDYVIQEGFSLCVAPPISYATRPDGGIDFRKTTANPGIFSIFIFLTQLNAEIEFMRSFKPDFVVSDSRISTLFASKLLGIPALTLLNLYKVYIPRERRFLTLSRIADGGILTIVGKAWSLGKKIYIPDFPAPYTLSLGNLEIPPSRKNKIKFIGPILPVRPEELSEKRVLRKKLGFDDKLVIFVPISGPTQEKAHFSLLMKHLLRKLPDEYRVVVSLGQPESSIDSFEEDNIIFYSWIPNRFEYLKACDLVISRAGLGTLSQAVCFGKPLILIPTPSQTEQMNNAKRAHELGVAKLLKQRDLNSKSLVSSIHGLFNNKDFIKTTENIGLEVSKYNATETLIKAIITRGEVL